MLITLILMSFCVFNISLALFSCPFQTCQTIQKGSSCFIDCQLTDGQLPSIGNQTIKSISEMTLKNASFIPDDSFIDLDIANLEINGDNLQNISENSFRKTKKIRGLLMSGFKTPNVIPDKSLKPLENSTKSLKFTNNHLDPDSLNQFLRKFNFLKSLQYMNLQNNKLFRFYSNLSDFSSLTYLDLANNSIFDLNITANLKTLQLSNNNMIELTRNMFKNLKFLTSLNISNNLVEALGTDVFSDLTQLNELYLGNNRIQFIEPDWINSNNSLKMLDLSNNKIEKISLKNFINLKYLNLSGNKIRFISDIRPEIRLLSLDISDNLLESVPVELAYLNHDSETINLSHNRLKNLNFLKNINCTNLKYFDVSHNLIELVFPQDLEQCTSLAKLDLSNNRIHIMEFPYLEKLTFLDAHNNHLVYLNRATLINLPNLEKFYASNNKILALDSSSFNNNSRLIELHLNRNLLSKIPNISKLFRLEVLNLENQNGRLSELTNFAFEKEPSGKEISRFLLVNLAKNNISKFEDRIFCTRYQNVINLKRINLIIDSINSMNRCILKQLSHVETIIYANNDQKCSLIQNRISNQNDHVDLGCDISSLTSDCFDQRYRCHYSSDFGKNNFTTWLSGDLHLYSFGSLYETCNLVGEHVCFALEQLSIYCHIEIKNGTYQMTNIKVVYESGSMNYIFTADKNSFSQGFNRIFDRIKKFLVQLYSFPPDHRIVLDSMKKIEINILRDEFLTLLIRTSRDNYKNANGILKSGCTNKTMSSLGTTFRLIGAKEKENIFKIAQNLGINYEEEKYFADLNDDRNVLLTTSDYNLTYYLRKYKESWQSMAIAESILKIPTNIIQELNCTRITINNFKPSLDNYDQNELKILNILNENSQNTSHLKSLVMDKLAEACYLLNQDSNLVYPEEKRLRCFGIQSDSRQYFCLLLKNSTKAEITETSKQINYSSSGQLFETTQKSLMENTRRSRPNFVLQMGNKPNLEESGKINFDQATTDFVHLSFMTGGSSSISTVKENLDKTRKTEIPHTSISYKERIVKNPVLTTYSSTSIYLCSDAAKIRLSKLTIVLFILIILNK